MRDPEFLAEAEQTLHDLEKALNDRLGASADTEEVPSISSAVGRLSFIDAHQQHQMDLHARRRLSDQLVAVKAALKRVAAGTYGICMRCGGPIPHERLEYLPETPFCTACTPGGGA